MNNEVKKKYVGLCAEKEFPSGDAYTSICLNIEELRMLAANCDDKFKTVFLTLAELREPTSERKYSLSVYRKEGLSLPKTYLDWETKQQAKRAEKKAEQDQESNRMPDDDSSVLTEPEDDDSLPF